MRGNSNRQVIRSLFLRRRSSIFSSSRLHETLISTPTKISPPIPSILSVFSNSISTGETLNFSTSPLQLFQRSLCSSSGGSSNIVLVESDEELNSALKNVIDKASPAICYFTASWCGPCKLISPVIEELSQKYPHVTVYKVDIDQEGLQNTLAKLHVHAVPTLDFYKKGKKTTTIVGADVTNLKDTVEDLYGEK